MATDDRRYPWPPNSPQLADCPLTISNVRTTASPPRVNVIVCVHVTCSPGKAIDFGARKFPGVEQLRAIPDLQLHSACHEGRLCLVIQLEDRAQRCALASREHRTGHLRRGRSRVRTGNNSVPSLPQLAQQPEDYRPPQRWGRGRSRETNRTGTATSRMRANKRARSDRYVVMEPPQAIGCGRQRATGTPCQRD